MNPNTKILFVDDEPYEVKYFKKIFEKEFSIETANSVETAKKILNNNHNNIAILITDHRMPKEVGLELLKFSQAKYPKIIRMLTTAFCDFGTAVDAINNVEVYKYITKPWDINELEVILREGLQRFNTKNKQLNSEHASSDKDILSEFTKDCHHWLDYSLHAYGDEYVYRSGIEALACQYQIKISRQFSDNQQHLYTEALTKIINKEFLSEEILNTIKNQELSLFSNSSTVSKRKH